MLNKWFDGKSPLLLALVFGLIVFGSRLHLIDLLAVSTPYWDDWGLASMLNKYVNNSVELADFFRASNEHRLVFNRFLTLVIFDLNQEQWDPMISMVLNALIWSFTGAFLIKVIVEQNQYTVTPVWPLAISIFWIFPISLVNLLWGVQTHNYTMIMFAVMGCWLISGSRYTKSWWFGVFCMLAACFTMAGGVFVAIAIAVFYAIGWLIHSEYRSKYLSNTIAALIVSCIGVYLILTQSGTNVAEVQIELANAMVTFLRAMSWPTSMYTWPSLVFIIPVFILCIHAMRNADIFNSRLSRFSICLYGFVFLVAIAIAFARDSGGRGPARRYLEFLALAPIASLLALLVIMQIKGAMNTFWRNWFPVIWLGTVLISVPNIFYVASYTLDDRDHIKPIQERIVKTYLSSEDAEVLQHRELREVPFPNVDMFATALLKYKQSDILPYQLQVPKALEHHPDQGQEKIRQSPFIENGTIFPSKEIIGEGLFGEPVIGSFRPNMEGMKAVGEFESLDFHLTRSYVMIPVIGYLGYSDLSLKLVDVFSGQEFNVVPESGVGVSRNAEAWEEVIVKVPKGYYRLVAVDKNSILWFGFGAPRTVGKLSYWNMKLIKSGYLIWQFGFLLLLLFARKSISRLFFKGNLE